MVLGIAATAIPFARTPEDEAERWLRLLRLHGEVGAVLQAIGVSEDSIREHAEQIDRTQSQAVGGDAESRDVIARVGERAARIARTRGVDGVGTTDLLMAVLEVYGAVFERALRAHGTDVEEVLERLAVESPPAPPAG
jgi:ATP-dependent Clp protease ATP-binding subunit ClpA